MNPEDPDRPEPPPEGSPVEKNDKKKSGPRSVASQTRQTKTPQAQPPTAPPRVTLGGAVGNGTGVGIGAVYAVWVSNLPSDHPYKYYLILSVSLVTVIVNAVVRIGWWLVSTAARELEHRWRVARLRKTLETNLGNSHTSDEHKAEMKRYLEELERFDVGFQKEGLQATRQSPP